MVGNKSESTIAIKYRSLIIRQCLLYTFFFKITNFLPCDKIYNNALIFIFGNVVIPCKIGHGHNGLISFGVDEGKIQIDYQTVI